MTPRRVASAISTALGVRVEDLTDHRLRGEDVMDARAAVAWVLHERLRWSGNRAAMYLGYKQSTASPSFGRLRLRVYSSARLRAQISLLFPPEERKAAA